MSVQSSHPPTDARAARIAEMYARGLAEVGSKLDPARHLVYQSAAQDPSVRTYRQSASLPLALALLREGDADSVAQAVKIVAAVLESQELSPRHPHRGNWLWLADDEEVGDINAVQFVMRGLLPVLVRYEHLVPAELVARCRESVRLAMMEEERIDVAPTYSNIHLMSLFALNVGGEWLNDPHFIALGAERWQRWVGFTLDSGAPHEYNSPNYGAINLMTLGLLQELVQNPTTRLQARLLYERLWLHAGLHVHRATGQVAAPHCRCYWGPMQTGRGPVKDLLWRETGWDWLLAPGPYGGDDEPPYGLELVETDHWLPGYLRAFLEHQSAALPYEVRETANRGEGHDLTTFFSHNFALGTASRTYAIGTDCFYIEHQADHLMLHYTRPAGGWGMMYSRYVVNDRHWGTLGAAPDRPKNANFYDQGHFAGVQKRNKAIGLYALQRENEEVFSLKTIVAFPSGAGLERVWVNEQPVDLSGELPHLAAGDWLVVEDGGVYMGVRPLEQSVLGRDAPIRLEWGPLGELWLVIYNYRGGAVRFWDYASLGGAFWRGNLKAGFVTEVAERGDYASASDFLAHLRRATVEDTTDDQHIRTIRYAGGGDEIALRYDLWNTRPVDRAIDGQPYTPPHLSSPLAVQGDSGQLAVGSATLTANPQHLFLVAQEMDPANRCWVVVNPQERPTPLRLETPAGVLTAEAFGMGRIEWSAPVGGEQVVRVESLEPVVGLSAPVGVTIHGV